MGVLADWVERVVFDAFELEAFTTQGGLETMCEPYAKTVRNKDCKTMRYPGYVDPMNFFFHALLMRERR